MANSKFVQALFDLVRSEMSESAVSSPTVTPDDMHGICRVDTVNHEAFEYVCDAILDGKAVRNISNPEHDDYVTGSAKNWVSNAGGLNVFKAMIGKYRHTVESENEFLDMEYPIVSTEIAVETSVPTMVADYFESRRDTTSAFVTNVFLVETGSYDGKQFGICVNDNGRKYVVGDLTGKGKVKAFREHTGLFRKVDKATKGHRFKLGDSEVMNVFTP